MDCLTKAASSSSSSSSSGSGSSSSYGNSSSDSYSNSDGYAYDPSDKYYSANDKDGDGKINDQEFQNALGDLLDDMAAEGYAFYNLNYIDADIRNKIIYCEYGSGNIARAVFYEKCP